MGTVRFNDARRKELGMKVGVCEGRRVKLWLKSTVHEPKGHFEVSLSMILNLKCNL